MVFIGMFLSVNWLPVNPKGLSVEQKREILEAGSLNRPLGLLLFYISVVLFLAAIIRGIYLKFR